MTKSRLPPALTTPSLILRQSVWTCPEIQRMFWKWRHTKLSEEMIRLLRGIVSSRCAPTTGPTSQQASLPIPTNWWTAMSLLNTIYRGKRHTREAKVILSEFMTLFRLRNRREARREIRRRRKRTDSTRVRPQSKLTLVSNKLMIRKDQARLTTRIRSQWRLSPWNRW